MPKTWDKTTINTTYSADRLAADIDSLGEIHVAFRELAWTARSRYTYNKTGASGWSPANLVSSDMTLGESLDVSAHGLRVYLLVARDNAAQGVDAQLYKVERTTDPYPLKKVWGQSSSKHYSWARLAVGATAVVTTLFTAGQHLVEATDATGARSTQKHNSTKPSPMPVAVDSAGSFWMVSAPDLGQDLRYKLWNGGSTLYSGVLNSSAVHPLVLDVGDGGSNKAYLIYRGYSTSGTTGLPMISRTQSAWGTAQQVSPAVAEDVRLKVNLKLKQAWFLYRVKDTLTAACWSLP